MARPLLQKFFESDSAKSNQWVLDEVFGIKSDFSKEIEDDLIAFYDLRKDLLAKNFQNEAFFVEKAKKLAQKGLEISDIVGKEIRQLNRTLGKDYVI